MIDQKKPFHEVLSTRLDIATVGVSGGSWSVREVKLILDVLLASRMPAWAAHQIARYFANLPSLLARAGVPDLAKFAEEVLNDLKKRDDEKEEEAQPVPAIAQ